MGVQKQRIGNVVEEIKDTADDASNERSTRAAYIGFENPHYAFLESCKNVSIKVIREGMLNATVSVKYATQEGTANAVTDFIAVSGELIFAPGETEKPVEIELVDDIAYEEDEDFFVELSYPQIRDGNDC